MYKKIAGIVILTNIILATFIPTTISAIPTEDYPWWDRDYDFRVNISIIIDTSKEIAKNQPIDVNIKFNNPCWAKDENIHSIRVVFQEENGFIELDSQIYNLSFTDNEIIDSCNLVFLIPEKSNGNEIYFVYYDDDPKESPNYEDHVEVSEDSYGIEPIPGINLESTFFQIKQDGYIVYAVNIKGSGLDMVLSQQVEKLMDKTETVKPNKAEYGISLGGAYYYRDESGIVDISTTDNLINSGIIVDGNLMVKVGITSQSNDGRLRSTVIYKYYFCPTEDKKMYLYVKHEVIKPPLPFGPNVDFSFLTFVCNRIKSASLADLNFGSIPPYLFYYNDEELIRTEKIEQFPEGDKLQMYIGMKDDQDLGTTPWFSVGEGETGRADALILDSNNVVKSGTDERNGVSIQLFEANQKLPGIENAHAFIYLGKNVFEGSEKPDEKVPDDYVVEFNAVFFTSMNGGLKAVEEEAKIFQDLIKLQPSEKENETNEQEEVDKYNLTVYTHFSPSFPFGSYLSTLSGINFSYLTAELFSNNQGKNKGTVSRLSLNENVPEEAYSSILNAIKNRKLIFDFKNFTFYKKYRFTDVEPGRYLVKIYRENPFLKSGREYIGYKIVNVEKDMSTDIYCKSEGKLKFSFFDQNNKSIENVQTYIKKENMIISNSLSDSEGKTSLKAPCGLSETYILNVTYKGFLISEEEIRLGLKNKYIPLSKTFNFDVYDFTIDFNDSKGNPPDFDVTFELTSNEMNVPVTLYPSSESNGKYEFSKIHPANYDLLISYNSMKIKETISIKKDTHLTIDLHDFETNIVDNWNLTPGTFIDVSLKSMGFEKNAVIYGKEISNGKYLFSNLYPGDYSFRINYKQYNLEEIFNVPHEKTTILFSAEFNLSTTVYDTHGNLLRNADVKISRDGKEENEKTNENGVVLFTVPPATYNLKILIDDELIAKRKIELLTNNDFSVVTTNEPILSYVVLIISIALIIGFLALCFKIKKAKLFLKILAISLAIMSIVTPWWVLEGSSCNPKIETSTTQYLVPPTMVDLIITKNVTAGSLTPLEDNLEQNVDLIFAKVDVSFLSIIDLLPKLIIIGVIFLLLSIILNHYLKKKTSILMFFVSILILLGSIIIFTIAMSILSSVTYGSFIGSGEVEFLIPGEKMYMTLNNSWGPSIGYYLLLISNIILIIIFIFKIKNPVLSLFRKILSKK